ncbi:hypothetical protein [Nocardioides bruguierae]|uniref:hypothetical protein n=1 Tax=Nocardioides bruguierae TaxID=2945102 RepID=UPI0020225FA2|nr:hypothetical protein [Nocardioides bruguierae]MCL8027328.1 hypothetical protein [Nocardioides bruguierae]
MSSRLPRSVRLLSASLSTVLLASGLSLFLAPAASADTTTTIVGGSTNRWLTASSYRTQPGVPKHGDALSLSINVETADGDQVYYGGLTVKRRMAGTKKWTTIATSEDDAAYLYDSTKAVGNATYRVIYAGGTHPSTGEVYAPSKSTITAKVQRNLNTSTFNTTRGIGLKGKVVAGYKRKLIAVERKQGKKWVLYTRTRTNAKARYRVNVAAPKKSGAKIKYRLRIPASTAYAETKSVVYTATRY